MQGTMSSIPYTINKGFDNDSPRGLVIEELTKASSFPINSYPQLLGSSKALKTTKAHGNPHNHCGGDINQYDFLLIYIFSSRNLGKDHIKIQKCVTSRSRCISTCIKRMSREFMYLVWEEFPRLCLFNFELIDGSQAHSKEKSPNW